MARMLAEKVIVVTGGTKGLGRATAAAAGREGARVVVGGRDEQAGRETVEEIRRSGSEAFFVRGDLRRVADCEALIAAAATHFGRLDGLVNYAGILPASPLTETTEDFFDSVFDLNFKAAFFCCRFAVSAMLKTGGGSIVNVGSTHAYGGDYDRAAYACSKGALLTLTKHIAINYARRHIRANWLTMGWVATPGELDHRRSEGRDLRWLEEVAAKVMPMGRLQTCEDNVPGILYLLSDQSSQVTGVELHVSGGYFPRGSVE